MHHYNLKIEPTDMNEIFKCLYEYKNHYSLNPPENNENNENNECKYGSHCRSNKCNRIHPEGREQYKEEHKATKNNQQSKCRNGNQCCDSKCHRFHPNETKRNEYKYKALLMRQGQNCGYIPDVSQ